MQNQRHNHLLASSWVCLMSGKVTAAVTWKHVKTVWQRKRRASDIDVTKLNQEFETHVLLVRCNCTEKFPALSPADLLHRRSQMTSMKH